MIVVDTTVLADLLFNEGACREAAFALQELDPEWLCVSLVRYEVGNVAWKLADFGGLDPDLLRLGLEGIEELLVGIEEAIDPVGVFEAAVKWEISFYDAAHVWLAESRGLSLYSRDERLRRKCPEVVRAMPEPPAKGGGAST